MPDVKIDPDDRTLTATRSLRSAGHSVTLTIPPIVLDAIKAGEGDEMELIAEMDSGRVVCRKVDDDRDE